MMPENSTKKLSVTFATGLPMGERGTFTHDGDLWIAYRAKKNQAIFALVDKLVNIHNAIHQEMIRWINRRPQDGEFIAAILEKVGRAQTLHRELCTEKTEAFTQ